MSLRACVQVVVLSVLMPCYSASAQAVDPTAALLAGKIPLSPGAKVVAMVTGGNVDVRL